MSNFRENTKTRYAHWLLMGFLVALFIVTRILLLDHFATADEKRWLIRSGNFYEALADGPLTNTFQQGHPGVTTMWAGLLGHAWTFPEYTTVADDQFNPARVVHEAFLAEHGQAPIDLLASARVVESLIHIAVFVLALSILMRILSKRTALLAALLIALDPFVAAHMRLLHTDGLLSSFLFLALVCLIWWAWRRQQRKGVGLPLTVGALATGLAWLTKTPAFFLAPFFALVLTLHFLFINRGNQPKQLAETGLQWVRQIVLPLCLWFVVAGVLYFVLWPALWVAPGETLGKVFDISRDYAAEGHSNPVFFGGEVLFGDPGFWFYPATYLWRATPLTLLGLLLALALVPWRRAEQSSMQRLTLWMCLSFAILFFLFMNLGAKKFDRYLLPIYMPLDLAAAVGWSAAVGAVHGSARYWSIPSKPRAIIPSILFCLLLGWQTVLVAQSFPYYLSYYNPILRWWSQPEESMMIGWGEGLDAAARQLAELPNAEELTIASWYSQGPFSYFFPGEVLPSQYNWMADYAVLYQSQIQRKIPSQQYVAHFARQEPDDVISLSGTDYAFVYKIDDGTPPPYMATWNDQILLASYTLSHNRAQAGDNMLLSLYLQNLAPIAQNLNMLVQIVNAEGEFLLRSDRWPFGSATADWALDELWVDRLEVTVPTQIKPGVYRIEVSFYDPATLDALPIVESASGDAVASPFVIDYIQVTDATDLVDSALNESPIRFGDQLLATSLELAVSQEGTQAAGPTTSASAEEALQANPGDSLEIEVMWQSLAHIDNQYTGFVHLVSADGQLIAQHDKPLTDGFIPLPLWYPHDSFADHFSVPIPADATGTFALHLGMYDPKITENLPILHEDGSQSGTIQIGTVELGTVEIGTSPDE